jgi:hypothetical protein
MTIRNLVRQAIEDNASHARASAAGLGADALMLAELASELPSGVTHELVKQAAHAIQARAHKALLGLLTATAAAARLEAYAHVVATRFADVRHELEIEAASDAVTYAQARRTEGEQTPPEQWATEAFAAWLEDASAEAIDPMLADEARACYVAAFLRALGAGAL